MSVKDRMLVSPEVFYFDGMCCFCFGYGENRYVVGRYKVFGFVYFAEDTADANARNIDIGHGTAVLGMRLGRGGEREDCSKVK